MKNFVLFIAILLFFISCSNSNEEKIVGFWELQKVNTNQKITNENEYRTAMVQLIKTTSMQFNKDYSFGATIWNDTSFGSWQIIGDTLLINDESNKVNFGVRIIQLTPKKMVLQEDQDSVVEILTFVK